jgi:hypothetical protein
MALIEHGSGHSKNCCNRFHLKRLQQVFEFVESKIIKDHQRSRGEDRGAYGAEGAEGDRLNVRS